jgi:hypothetical protein
MDGCGCLGHLVDSITSLNITINSTTVAGKSYTTHITYENTADTPPGPAPQPGQAAAVRK